MIRDTSAQDAAIDPAPARQRRRRFVIGGLAVVALGVSVQGQVVAAVSPTLYAPTTGTVTTQVNAGDKVTKGQPLAVVDSPELLSEFERERSTLLSLQAAHGRQRGVVANFERRVEELTVALAGRRHRRQPGLAVQQRAAVAPNQPLLTVVDLSVFEVELAVPESCADDLAIEMPAEITYDTSRYAGVVTSISPEVLNGQVVGRVRFAEQAPADLRQNQRVSVRIVLEEKADVLVVDRGAFVESGGGRPDRRLEPRAVRPRRDRTDQELTGSPKEHPPC